VTHYNGIICPNCESMMEAGGVCRMCDYVDVTTTNEEGNDDAEDHADNPEPDCTIEWGATGNLNAG